MTCREAEIFGTYDFCNELVDHIGLQEDDNRNLTRRVLLILESVPSRMMRDITKVGNAF